MRAPRPLQFGAHPATRPFVLTPVVCLGMGNPTPGHVFASGPLRSEENLQDLLPGSQEGTLSVPQCLVGINSVFLASWPLPGSLGLIQRPLPVQEDSGEGLRVWGVHSRAALDWGSREPASSPRAALCATQSFRRAEPPAQGLQPSEGNTLPYGPGAPATDPTHSGTDTVPTSLPGPGPWSWGSQRRPPRSVVPGPPEGGQVETESRAHAHIQLKDSKARENPTKRWRWASDYGRDKWGSRRAR